jgi:hypothetical protein
MQYRFRQRSGRNKTLHILNGGEVPSVETTRIVGGAEIRKSLLQLDFPGKTSYLKSNGLFDFSHRHP